MAVTVKEVVKRYMGDANMSSASIAEKAREEIPGSNADAGSVATQLTFLRMEYGEEAVPKRKRGRAAGSGGSIKARVAELIPAGTVKVPAKERVNIWREALKTHPDTPLQTVVNYVSAELKRRRA